MILILNKITNINVVYQDIVSGVIRIECPNEFKHDNIMLTMEGNVILTLSTKNVGVLEAFYNSIKV